VRGRKGEWHGLLTTPAIHQMVRMKNEIDIRDYTIEDIYSVNDLIFLSANLLKQPLEECPLQQNFRWPSYL
jgi:hypothetical protein